MDETSLSTVQHTGKGFISGRRPARRDRRTKPRDANDRNNTRTTYLAVVADCAALQPLLPQVILPKYTQHAVPSPAHLDVYASYGFPFEFWHRSQGCATPSIIRDWATRIRSAVRSFNNTAWVALIMDCSTTHLCSGTVSHLRRLGFIVVLVPAKLTWLVQLLDAYVFGLVKKEMRLGEARQRVLSGDGKLMPFDRMQIATNSIRRHVINKDWSASFNKLGAGSENRPTAASLLQYCDVEPVLPALPSLAEFAELVCRPAHTEVTRRLHHQIIGGALELAGAPHDALPGHAAEIDLPESFAASAAVSREEMAATPSQVYLIAFS